MRSLALSAVFATGCSFVLVHGPSQRIETLPTDGSHIDCTESAAVPLADTIGGIAAITAAGAGVLVEQTSNDGKPEHFTAYYAGPLAAVAIAYFISASRGNSQVTWCRDVNERLNKPGERVIPVDPNRHEQLKDKENPLPNRRKQQEDKENPL